MGLVRLVEVQIGVGGISVVGEDHLERQGADHRFHGGGGARGAGRVGAFDDHAVLAPGRRKPAGEAPVGGADEVADAIDVDDHGVGRWIGTGAGDLELEAGGPAAFRLCQGNDRQLRPRAPHCFTAAGHNRRIVGRTRSRGRSTSEHEPYQEKKPGRRFGHMNSSLFSRCCW